MRPGHRACHPFKDSIACGKRSFREVFRTSNRRRAEAVVVQRHQVELHRAVLLNLRGGWKVAPNAELVEHLHGEGVSD